jgi:hypothetical protein
LYLGGALGTKPEGTEVVVKALKKCCHADKLITDAVFQLSEVEKVEKKESWAAPARC